MFHLRFFWQRKIEKSRRRRRRRPALRPNPTAVPLDDAAHVGRADAVTH